ncbi:MAG: DNA polymerase III [Candidatus Harrisonbacteria bacterium RIFCSPHIGHO2_12_FULL_48_16]|uniref:DNA polymerase beta n=1 Tax=Candidatus Harrisonbacteria bacterium RIFCSPHIGHO2_12_FULL_48_16 TaxID=1798405 RepID=A0A1G1ZLX9_9BACT|nr:MAG: DNA polymerase III [Candidatus Harrisonbacteria bacterium RIFCSPHIGHO2_12_FULL_48_16]
MKVSNQEIANILYEIGEYLEMQDVAFKPRAYEKAAQTIESLAEDAGDIYKKGGLKALENIPGIGVSIAEKIEELLKTGKCQEHELLKKKTPVDLANLTKVEGLGPKKIKVLYQKLKIKNIGDLEKAAKAGKIAALEGFGEKSEQNILKGLEFLKKGSGRFPLPLIMGNIMELRNRLKSLKDVERLEVAGSVRRYKETVGDADILVISKNPKPIMDYFVSMPEVAHVYAHGPTKSAVKLKSGLDVDVRIVPEESYGAALMYFTGSKDHNVALRELAIKKGYTLNEYGLFKGTKEKKGKLAAGKTEEEIYRVLGLEYIEPEMREMTGEIELAQKNSLPKIIGYGDLKGDLQVQTNWTDGEKSIEEMAMAAMKIGLEYIAITDHTKRLAMTHGLDEKRLMKQMQEIDELNRKFKIKNTEFKILRSTECDILEDGSLDLPDEILKKLDVVGASVHSHFNLSEIEQTKRVCRAMKNPNVDIIFHPTGRIVGRREAYNLDMSTIIKTAKETCTILEINGSDRLDLRDQYIRMCVDAGVKMSIDSDAHNDSQLYFSGFGIAQARRGWATKNDIINAWSVDKMLSFLK